MAPSRKVEAAFMGMMERFLETNAACECPDCRKSSKKLKKFTASMPRKDLDAEFVRNIDPGADHDHHLCSEHRPVGSTKRNNSKDKDKPTGEGPTMPLNRADKVRKLLTAQTVTDVLEVLKSTPSTTEENQLANDLQQLVSSVKTYPESKAKIVEHCNDDTVDLDAAFGLLAKFRQERSVLTSALIRSNEEREKVTLDRDKCLQAVHEVNDLMYMLRDVAKEGKGPAGEEMRHSMGNMIFKIHELASNPSSLYEELIELRDEYDDQVDRFRDVESCHEKLHEDKRKLQDDIAAEKREHLETRRKLSSLQSTKNEVNQAHKSLDKSHNENTELRKEIDKLNAEVAKMNALKHENTQLKKKLAAADAPKPEPKVEEKAADTQPTKKKKNKKGSVQPDVSEHDQSTSAPTVVYQQDPEQQKALKLLELSNAEMQNQLETARGKLRQLERQLHKSESAKADAVEKRHIEQATAESLKEESQNHFEQSQQLREQLEQSECRVTTLQDSVDRLERNLAVTRTQMEALSQTPAPTSNVQSHTQTPHSTAVDSRAHFRKLRADTSLLLKDLGEANPRSHDGWNIVHITRNRLIEIDRDIADLIEPDKESEMSNAGTEAFLPPMPPNDVISQSSLHLPRLRETTPPLGPFRQQNRPLLPPGLSEPTLGRASPKPSIASLPNTLPHQASPSTVQHRLSPIGTGRPSRNSSGVAPSPTHAPARPASMVAPATNSLAGGGIGNGAPGVDWSIWTKR